ncbi:MAG: LysR family transcriptional regulator [Roseibium sp.]|nr:LysR family transcriptional regulator [Roseibium sp.]
MRQVEWSDLKLLLAFERGGTARRAGELAGVSHSTVSRRLDQLEKTVGVSLFERSGRGFRLTEAGQEMFASAERIEDEVLRLERKSFGQDQVLSGPVTLTCPDSLASEPFLRLLSEFCDAYPTIDLKLDTGHPVVNLDRREADLALRLGAEPEDYLVGRRLLKAARAVYASRPYLKRLNWDPNLYQARWISFSSPEQDENWKKTTPFPDLPTRLRCFDIRSQVTACRAGHGLVLLPCFLGDAEPDLVRVSTPKVTPRLTLWLLRHPDSRGNARVRALSEFLTSKTRSLEPLVEGKTARTWEGGPLE